MAILDSRLLRLIEVLAESGFDWLAFELMDAVREGRPTKESQDSVEAAQHIVRKQLPQQEQTPRRPSLPPVAEPILGDAQIEWASAYVLDRLTDMMNMLEVSMNQLDEIASPIKGANRSAKQQREASMRVLLQAGEEGPVINRSDLTVMLDSLSRLERALRGWTTHILDGGESDA